MRVGESAVARECDLNLFWRIWALKAAGAWMPGSPTTGPWHDRFRNGYIPDRVSNILQLPLFKKRPIKSVPALECPRKMEK